MKIKLFLFLIVLSICLNAQVNTTYSKQKLELQELKKELNEFYNKKEVEYKTRKKELNTLLMQIQKEKKEIELLTKKNEQILERTEGVVKNKMANIYNNMNSKAAAKIFDKIIEEGKIEDVFDIIITLRPKHVTKIMRYLNIENAAILTRAIKDNGLAIK